MQNVFRMVVLFVTSAVLIAPALSAQQRRPSASPQRRVEYDVSFPNAAQHEARVVVTFRGVPMRAPLRARMSRSSPGRYAVHSFAKNVYDVTAADSRGRQLRITRPDPHGWDVTGHDGTVTISYTVWGDRIDGTFLSVDRSHAHMNMPATFMWAHGMNMVPIQLTIHPLPGWRVATQLKATSDTVFTAPNLQYFLDSPTEVGPITVSTWQDTFDGKRQTWRLAVHHLGTAAEVDSLAQLTRAVVAEHVAVWGEAPTFDYGTYTFINDYLPWAAGDGMEHRNSTIVTGRRELATRAGRIGALGTISHEFFHAWNVERLRPKSLEPFDFERENMSGELWLAEGFTSYYGPLTIRRAGLITDEEFAAEIASDVIATIDAPGRQHFSAVEMSMQAPFVDAATFVDPTSRANTFLSYYTWGAAIGLALDLYLRASYGMSLDDYMRALWREHGQYQSAAFAPLRPYTMQNLKDVLGRLTRDTTAANEFFFRYIEGRGVPDFAALLAPAGFTLSHRGLEPSFGVRGTPVASGFLVEYAIEGGSAYGAGITNGDVIVAVNRTPTSSLRGLDASIADRRIGEVVQVEVIQHGVQRTIPVTIAGRRMYRLATYETAGLPITPAIRAFRSDWLGSKASR